MIHAGHDVEEIKLNITRHLKNGHYARNSVYGNGDALKKIAVLSSVPLSYSKRIAYYDSTCINPARGEFKEI